jgi:acyl-coenzyme A synthetase/AMP-(fatty) acid ligase
MRAVETDPRELAARLDRAALPAGSVARRAAALAELLPKTVAFETSGTTGRPEVWSRTATQLTAETTILSNLVRDERVQAVVTHAPVRHLYGFLLGCLLPTVLDLPVLHLRVTDPMPTRYTGLLVVAVPSSWWHLEKSVSALSTLDHISVVHSTASLPEAAARVVAAVPELCLRELHGSTETGLVGVRRAVDADWELAEDVSFADDDPAPSRPVGDIRQPRIRSPRLGELAGHGQATEHTLDDIVEVTGARTYRLTGRRQRLVKIDGRRVDMTDVERALRRDTHLDVSCDLVRDTIRGEWYDVLVIGGERERLAVAAAVERLLPTKDAPRAVRAVPSASAAARKRSL